MKTKMLSSVVLSALMLGGCGGGGSSSGGTSYAVSGVAVDPYISGAVFCEDKDGSDTCDGTEQLSTTSDANGNFYFSNALAGTGQILMKSGSFGTHNGTAYDLQLAIPISSSATSSINITPMTTLMARGDFNTNNDLATSLNTSYGLANGGVVAAPLTGSDIVANPLTNLTLNSSTVTDDELKTLRAQLASYTSLKVLEQLKAKYPTLSATDYQHALGVVYGSALKLINAGLSAQLLSDAESYKQTITSGVPVTVPPITLDDITKTAIAISQRLATVGADACENSAPNSSHMLIAEAAVTTKMGNITGNNGWGMQLGQRYYAVRNKAFFQTYKNAPYYVPTFGSAIDAGLSCASGVFYIDSSDTIQCQ